MQIEYPVRIEVNVSPLIVCDLFMLALQHGACDAWLDRASLISGQYEQGGRPWFSDVAFFQSPFEIAIKVKASSSARLGIAKTITDLDVRKGLQCLADAHSRRWNDIRCGNLDGATADAFMQCVVFGDLVPG